jgi:hypothetical protein
VIETDVKEFKIEAERELRKDTHFRVGRRGSSAYAGDHGLGGGGMRNSGWGLSGDTLTMLRRISLRGG